MPTGPSVAGAPGRASWGKVPPILRCHPNTWKARPGTFRACRLVFILRGAVFPEVIQQGRVAEKYGDEEKRVLEMTHTYFY